MLDHPRSAIVGLSLILRFGFDPIYSFEDTAIFTALHGMQTRSSDENSVNNNNDNNNNNNSICIAP